MTYNEVAAARFLARLRARSEQFRNRQEAGNLSDGYIALDLIRALYSAHGNVHPQAVRSALDDPAWRTDTVEIPTAFIKVIAEAWGEYLEQQSIPQGKTLGQCFKVEAQRQGRKGAAKLARTEDRAIALSNRVVEVILSAEEDGKPIKQTAAIALVAEREEVSEVTVRNAFRRIGRPLLGAYREAVKTSRG